MFKGIKKRFSSARAVHPSDLIVNPHSRRSLERGGGLSSPCSGKSPPTPTPGGGVLLPDEAQHTPLHHSAYPITPNLVVTGGKIEFITPPGSTLSSQASGNSTLKLSPTSTLPHNQDTLPHDHNTTLAHTPLHHHDHIIINNNNINVSNTNNANTTITTTPTIITTSLDSPTTPTKAKESGSSNCSGSSNSSNNSSNSNNTSATASPSPTSKTRTLPLFPSTPTTTTTTTTSLPSPACRTTTSTATTTTTTTTRSYSASFKRKNNRHVEEDDETTTDDFDDDVQDESNTKKGISRVSHSNSRNISSQSRPRSGPPHASNRRRHHIRGSDMAAKEGGNGTGTGKSTVVALRQENQQVKNRLTFLQQEFATLEQQVRALVSDRRLTALHQEEQREQREATEAAYLAKLSQYQQTIQELEDSLEDAPVTHNNDLVKLSERCTSLESANATLAMEARLQQQQYERCLDHIASHLVQALLNQKTIQQQRLKMAHQLRDLQRQNAALTSLVRRGGSDPSTTMPSCHHQLRHRNHKTHPSLEHNPGFYSLPSSPSKIKATGWVESWHLEESSNSHLSDALTSFLDTTDPQDLSQGPIDSLGEAGGGSQSAAVHLQEASGCCVLQTLATTGTTTTTTTTTACWYDIINTLNSGTGASANNTGNLGGMRLSCLTSSQSVSSWSQADGLNHLEGTFVSISSCSSSPTATPPSQSPRQPPHSVLFPHPHNTLLDGSQLEPQTPLRIHGPNTGVAAAVSRLPSSYLSPESSAASIGSKFFPLSPESLGATSSTTSIEHKPLCPGFTREEKVMINKVDTTLSPRDIVEQLLEKDNASQKLNNLNKSDVTCVLSAIESEVSIAGIKDYHSNLEAIVSEKGKDNLNISKVDVKSLMLGVKVHNNSNREEAVVEISTTKDEGYSTMSSDVQAEVKDSVTTTCSVTTVEEESTSLNIFANKEMTTVTTSNSGSNSISREVASTANVENCEEKSERKDNIEIECNGNAVNQTTKVISDKNDNCILKESKKIISINMSRPTEYSDGLRVVYDMENSNPDIFFLPIPDPENAQLYRHSYDNSQAQEIVTETGRWYSDSQLYVHKMAKDKAKVITSNAEKKLDIIDLSERAASEVLRRCNSKKILQALPKTEVANGHEGMFIDTESEGEDERKQRMAEHSWLSKERRFLSPTYSHAELEDWDLDLSSECLVSNGGDIEVATEEHSEATSVSGAAHQGSVPSLQQEITPDLDEDSNDFLWNGATYLKEDLLDGGELKDDPNHPNWSASSKKDLEHWHLTEKDHQQHQVLLSPRSGCSDQPAERWSSSEQLSCCSEGFSVRSSDFENFCEQLCTLPELKRVSFCSSEAGGGREGAVSEGQMDDDKDGAAPSSNCSMEDGDEFGDELNIDTVFTRDFYRLVKFESIKSLAASSKSLATNDGILTLEKLKDLEASGVRKETLASVLGFIAEQQKYCQEREAQDSAPKPRDDPYRTLGAISSSELAKQAALTNGAFSQNSPLHAAAKDSISRSSVDRRTLPTKSKLASSACLNSNQSRSSKVPSTSTTNSAQTPTPVSSTSGPTCTPTPAPRKIGPPVPAKPRSPAAQPRIPVCSQTSPMRCPSPPCPPGYNRSSLPPPCSIQVPRPPPHRGQFPPRPSSMIITCHNAHPSLSTLPPPVPVPIVPPPPAALLRNSSRIYSGAGVMVSDLYSVPPDEVFDMPTPPPSGIGSDLIPSCMLPEGPAPPVPRRSSSMGFATQQGPPDNASGAPPVMPHLINPHESPPVPKRVTSRALPPLPSEMMPGYPHLTPGSSHSLDAPRCSGVTAAETRRPLSFIKDTFGMGGPRRSNSDPQSLPGFSNQSPAGMLLELQRMAQVEEEEEEAVVKETTAASRTTTMSKSDEHLYEPGSPVDNVGLGTGWVRVEPSHLDLQDPQARANLLDGMMESSEGCSSGTEDDDGAASATASNNPQHSQLRHLHRNRRKKKASLRSGGQVGPPATSRPSILGRQDLFTRFGDKEMAAIQEFDFLAQHSSNELLESGELARNSNRVHDVGSGKESAQLGELLDPFEKSERIPQESPKSASVKDESKVSASNTLSSQYGSIIPKHSTSCQTATSKAAPVTATKKSLSNPKNSHTSKHPISNSSSNAKHPTTSQIITKHPTANPTGVKQSSIIPSPSPNTATVRQPSPTTQITQRQPTFLASPPKQLTPRSISPRNTSSKQSATNQQLPNQKSTKQRSPRQVASRQSYPNHTSCSSYAPPSEASLCRRIPSPVDSSSVPTTQSGSSPTQTPINVSPCQTTFPSHHPSFILLQQSHPPLAKPSRKNYSRNISVDKSYNVKKSLCYEKEKSKCEVDSSKCEKDTINIEDQKNMCEKDTIYNSVDSKASIECEGVDTRRMGSVRSTINQLNKINTFSGIKQPATPLPSLNTTATTSTANTPTTSLRSASTTTNINIPTSNSSLVNNNNYDNINSKLINTSSYNSKNNISTNKLRANTPRFKVFNRQEGTGDSSGSNVIASGGKSANTKGNNKLSPPRLSVDTSRRINGGGASPELQDGSKSSSPTRIPRVGNPLPSSSKKQTAGSVSNHNQSSKMVANSGSRSPSLLKRSLPPKGLTGSGGKSPNGKSSLHSRNRTGGTSPGVKLCGGQQQGSNNKNIIPSPRLARLRTKGISDPLDAFIGKGLCDSGSSEGSERCGGRLSLSDSCAENFSPIDSGDEVFDKIS